MGITTQPSTQASSMGITTQPSILASSMGITTQSSTHETQRQVESSINQQNSGIIKPTGSYIDIPKTLFLTSEEYNVYKVCK
jgi:hypothetical protein